MRNPSRYLFTLGFAIGISAILPVWADEHEGRHDRTVRQGIITAQVERLWHDFAFLERAYGNYVLGMSAQPGQISDFIAGWPMLRGDSLAYADWTFNAYAPDHQAWLCVTLPLYPEQIMLAEAIHHHHKAHASIGVGPACGMTGYQAVPYREARVAITYWMERVDPPPPPPPPPLPMVEPEIPPAETDPVLP